MQHQWKLKEDGTIDDYTFDSEFCSGPTCIICEESYCEFCNKNLYTTHQCPGPDGDPGWTHR